MKAIVLEIKNGEAAVLREDGIVVTTRQACRVGDTIEVPDRIEQKPSRKFGRLTRIAAVAVAAIVIAGSTFGYMTVSASSYVSVDAGDTSLEFGINRFGNVVSVEGLDEDSVEFADFIRDDVRHRKFDQAMDHAMNCLEERGSIAGTEDDQIIAGVTCGSEKQREELTDGLEAAFRKDGHGPKVYTVNVTAQERNEARDCRQSPGMFVFEQREDWSEDDWDMFFEDMERSDHPPLGPGGQGPRPPFLDGPEGPGMPGGPDGPQPPTAPNL